jgi:hypothetical protein
MLTEQQAIEAPIMCKETDIGKIHLLSPEDIFRPTSDEKGINNPTRLRTDEDTIKSYQEWIDNPSAGYPIPTIKPCYRNINGKIYLWELVDGFHRHTAMERQHTPKYWFREVDHTNLEISDIIGSQLKQNDHPDHVKLGIKGIANALSTLIQKNAFGKKENITDTMLRTYLNKHLKKVRSKTIEGAIRKTLKLNGVPTDVNVLDDKEKTEFVNTNGNYKLKGNLDKNKNAFGWDCLEGYEDRKVAKAIKQFRKEGKPSYFLCQVQVPEGNNTVAEKRESMLERFLELEKDILHAADAIRAGQKPFWVENYFPQDNQKKEKDWILKKSFM